MAKMMGHKGHHHAQGGKVEPELKNEVTYAGGGSNVEKEAKEKNKGGRACRKDGGAVKGKMSKMRLDRPGRNRGGRAGADMSPLTTASKVKDAGEHRASEGDALEGP